MDHPFASLAPEYSQLFAKMVITRVADVDAVARRLLGFRTRYLPVSTATGIPIAWIAASFEREASSDFRLSPAQGDPWNRVSVHVPKGRGPFPSWEAAALDAYHLNGLDKVGAGNWTWELGCYYGELFNGFGYRDFHHMHSPYLWGGTNIQTAGKYTSDGVFDPNHMDAQLGIVPIISRMIALNGSLAFPRTPVQAPVVVPAPQAPAPIVHNARWVQINLNSLGQHPPLTVDGSYGPGTEAAVKNFQIAYKLEPDGLAGEETCAKITELITRKGK